MRAKCWPLRLAGQILKSERHDYRFDVGLSFAGEDRDVVEAVALRCRELGLRVFYDRFYEAELWGKNLFEHLTGLYRNSCRYCVLFVSEAYSRKEWGRLERRSAQSRSLASDNEYILPVRLDDTDLPGLLDTTAYLDLRRRSPKELADLIFQKINPCQRETSRISGNLVVELKSDEAFSLASDMEMHELHYKVLEALGFGHAMIVGCEPNPHRLQVSVDLESHTRLRELFLSGELAERTMVTWRSVSSLEGKESAPAPWQVPLSRLKGNENGRGLVCHGGSIEGMESEAWRAWDYLGGVNVEVSEWRNLQAFITENSGFVYVHSNFKKSSAEDTTKIATDCPVDLFELFINLVFSERPTPIELVEARLVHERFARYGIEKDKLGVRGDEFYSGAMNIEFL